MPQAQESRLGTLAVAVSVSLLFVAAGAHANGLVAAAESGAVGIGGALAMAPLVAGLEAFLYWLLLRDRASRMCVGAVLANLCAIPFLAVGLTFAGLAQHSGDMTTAAPAALAAIGVIVGKAWLVGNAERNLPDCAPILRLVVFVSAATTTLGMATALAVGGLLSS